MERVTVARNAMATRFEVALHGKSAPRLRAAAEEALAEIESWEARLSLYRPASEIAHVNARAAREPVPVSPPVFALLAQCARLQRETGGLFDITVGPLIRCWGFMGRPGGVPDAAAILRARAVTGMSHVRLDPAANTVSFDRPGVMLDLGAIGKGFAIGQAAECLREAGIESALFHGGTSTVLAVGRPPDEPGWRIAIESAPPGDGPTPPPLGSVLLQDGALSVSAVWGRCFEAEGRRHGHVIDPRTGEPARDAVLAAMVTRSAAESDALSTALLTGGPVSFARLAQLRPEASYLLAGPTAGNDPSLRCWKTGMFEAASFGV